MLIQQTSRDAYESVNRGNIPIRQQILDKFHVKSSTGCYYSVHRTCDELEYKLGAKHQTVSAAIRSLVKEGVLQDSGFKRKTRSGRSAICWELVDVPQPNNLL
jgi:predicted transcriptional regulator